MVPFSGKFFDTLALKPVRIIVPFNIMTAVTIFANNSIKKFLKKIPMYFSKPPEGLEPSTC